MLLTGGVWCDHGEVMLPEVVGGQGGNTTLFIHSGSLDWLQHCEFCLENFRSLSIWLLLNALISLSISYLIGNYKLII